MLGKPVLPTAASPAPAHLVPRKYSFNEMWKHWSYADLPLGLPGGSDDKESA